MYTNETKNGAEAEAEVLKVVDIPEGTDFNNKELATDSNKSNQKSKAEKWMPTFFYWSEKESKIKIKLLSLITYLRNLGFYRLDRGIEFIFIRINKSIAEEFTITRLQDVFDNALRNLPDKLSDGKKDDIKRQDLIEQMYKGLSTYFSKHLLSRLGNVPNLSFLEAQKEAAYFCFKNSMVKVTKKGIEPISYKELNGKIIWKNSILDNSFSKLKLKDFEHSVFARFIRNLAKNKSEDKLKNIDDPEREQALKTIIGYNLHSYFHSKLKATILTDTGISDEAEGRTGKTLLVKAMGKMLNAQKESTTYVELAGKNFDFSKSFRYELCELDTKLVHLNDVKDNFPFELLYNDITEGITVEGKNKKAFMINAKIIVSTNRTIKINGGSDKDRSVEFQVSDHYSYQYNPENEFGHWFFRDWDNTEWNRFYNYMLHCVQQYFIHGLIIPNNIDLEERKLREETKPEFVEYMDACKIVDKVEFNKAEIFSDFIATYPDFDSKLRQRTFTDWIKKWAKRRDKIKSISERRSGKKSYVTFFLNQDD